jgi:superfamily I DNA/RNA helicase
LDIDLNILPQLLKIAVRLDQENLSTNSYLTEEKIRNFLAKLKEELNRDPEKNTEEINLSTIHGAKGLEFDHVFLIFCDKKVLPNKEKFTKP